MHAAGVSLDGESFRTYDEHVLVPTLRPDDIFVIDNLGRHKGKIVRQIIRAAGAKLFFPSSRLFVHSAARPVAVRSSAGIRRKAMLIRFALLMAQIARVRLANSSSLKCLRTSS